MANSRKHTSDSSVNRSNLVVTRTLRVKTGEPPFRSPTPETCLRVVVGASELDPASYGPNTEIRGMLDAVFVMRDESVFETLERRYMSTLRASTCHFDTFASTLISAVRIYLLSEFRRATIIDAIYLYAIQNIDLHPCVYSNFSLLATG